jgi:hypothetical protein
MATFGAVKKADISAVSFLDKREIMRKMIDITNEGSSFALWLQWLGRYEKTSMTNYHNFVNTELFSTETIIDPAVTVHTANTEISVQVATANGLSFPRAGEIIQIPGADKRRAIVVSKTSNAGGDILRLKSEDGLALQLANGQVLAVTGSVAGEGGTYLEARKYFPTKRMNNIQIFDEAIYKSTDIQMFADIEVEINGQMRYANKQEVEGMLVFMKNISNSFLFNKGTGDNFITTSPTHTDANGNAMSTTKGLLAHIEAEGINLAPGTTVGDTMFDYLKRQYDKKRIKGSFMVLGGSELDIQWDNYFYNFGGAGISPDNTRINLPTGGTENSLALGIKSYSRYNLTFNKMPLLALNEPGTANFTGSAGYNNYMFILPEAPVSLVGGQSAPGIRARYMELPSENTSNASSNGMYRTTKHGRYAPDPNSAVRTLEVACETKQGLEVLNAPHCAVAELQASGS